MLKYLRGIAKARMKAMGIGNVNRKMSLKKDGVPNWKIALYGKTGKDAERAQMNYGTLVKAAKKVSA